jgi:hypothetical protein
MSISVNENKIIKKITFRSVSFAGRNFIGSTENSFYVTGRNFTIIQATFHSQNLKLLCVTFIYLIV